MSRKLAKFFGVLLTVIALAVTQIPVSDVEAEVTASDFQMEGNKLLKYTGTAEVVSIPDGIKVIGEEAFAGNDYLVKVIVGGDVESVGNRAFADCSNLRTLVIGDTVREMETASFSNNKSLKNVTLGANLQKVGSGVFAGDEMLEAITLSEQNPYLCMEDGILYDDEKTVIYFMLPEYQKAMYSMPLSVTEVKAYAFWGNPYLEYVKIGSGLTNISAYAFSNCMNLKEVNIPLPVRSIEAKAFEDCVSLRNVILPDSMGQINETAFDGCRKVSFEATPGSYGDAFALARKESLVEQIEYEDVSDSTIIDSDEFNKEENKEETKEESKDDASGSENTEGQENNQNLPADVHTISGSYSTKRLLGQSSIVAGRAVIFIENAETNTGVGAVNQIDLSGPEKEEIHRVDSSITDLITDNAEKGKDFPKYTIVGNKIASQAYYRDTELSQYEIPENITDIGDFAFARSGLSEVVIPKGVKTIGYGAFYHCDDLSKIEIPDSVTFIDANAFEKTPYLDKLNQEAAFVIVGDGILISYNGSDSIINIPATVKQIAPEVFKNHMGITAVNIPDSVEIIGEAAFLDCKNLTTVNGGNQLKTIGASAFRNCPLSKVVIPASVREIGIGAFDFKGGTDTAVLEGTVLPNLILGDASERLAASEDRTYAFGGVEKIIVPTGTNHLKGTVLESGTYGFNGLIYDEAGSLVSDNKAGVTVTIADGVNILVESNVLSKEKENIMATLPGSEDALLLSISDSSFAKESISSAYSELYGGKLPSELLAFDMTLYDAGGQIPIRKLGKQYMTVMIPLPAGYQDGQFHMVTLDEDGQLEAVENQVVSLSDGDYIQFKTNHFSPFGIYKYSAYSGYSGYGVVSNGNAFVQLSGKDDTPDTGDFVHPKWILAVGLLAAAVALFFYKGKKTKVRH
ncbi:MAG: leucine-rich repeat domain-containing protein [Lachnospiraceae bacterium]|nr:leucine-rich repeat domain-containing protein [Lachnospiraceae bacterium]